MKSPVSILAIVPFLVCVVTPAARGATSARLVSEWRFENNADDTSGSANNGVSSGAPVYVPGRFGQAVYLSRADSIQKTGAANLPVLAADSWSCNQWIYLTNAPDSLAFFTGFGNASSSA